MPLNAEKLAKLQAKSTQKVGGMRRKKKIVQKTPISDDKRLQSTLKKFSSSTLQGIDEVNMFKDDGNVIHFKNPKVTASPGSNTFTVSGQNDTKKLTDIPGVLNQLGLEGIQSLQAWAKQQGMMEGQAGEKANDNGIPATGNFDEIDVE